MGRTIVVVADLDAKEPEHRFRAAASLLDPLSAPQLALFRRAVRPATKLGMPASCAGSAASRSMCPCQARAILKAATAETPSSRTTLEWRTTANGALSAKIPETLTA